MPHGFFSEQLPISSWSGHPNPACQCTDCTPYLCAKQGSHSPSSLAFPAQRQKVQLLLITTGEATMETRNAQRVDADCRSRTLRLMPPVLSGTSSASAAGVFIPSLLTCGAGSCRRIWSIEHTSLEAAAPAP